MVCEGRVLETKSQIPSPSLFLLSNLSCAEGAILVYEPTF